MPSYRVSRPLSILLLILAAAACLNCSVSSPDAASASVTPATKTVESKVTFLAVGDIMLSRGVARRIAGAGDPLLPFRKLEGLLKSTDFNFGNLESPVSGKDNILGVGLRFNVHTKDIAGLSEYNFKVLNLANNHAFDQKLEGLRATRRYMDEKGIIHMGTGDDLEEAWRPQVITVNGIRIGFIGASYASYNDGGVARHDYVARIEDVDYLKRAIQKLKTEADYIVVTMHAGTEYVDKVDPVRRKLDKGQMDFAHAAVDLGADLVIGAHPHWIQNFETYSGKYIFYSLGNFIFDMRDPIANQGLALKITLRGEKQVDPQAPPKDGGFKTRIEKIEFIPVIIEDFSTPRLASAEEADRILKRLSLPKMVTEPGVAAEAVPGR